MSITRAHFIFFVADQARSTAFYRAVLDVEPALFVPGMTELTLPGGAVLGLMPAAGIARLLEGRVDPASSTVPRAELYLVVDDPAAHLARATAHGAELLSALAPRDWGHTAGYVRDPDGHVLAFARQT